MKPLIDGDILVYECSFAGEDRKTGEIHSDTYVIDLFDEKVAQICRAVEATETPSIYLTGPSNFRFDVAKTAPYKGNRSAPKPFHYNNLRAYVASLQNTHVSEGLEADDELAIEQTRRFSQKDTIICSRDKDLRMVGGYHYGWEAGGQAEYYPTWVDPFGFLTFRKKEKNGKTYIDKVSGGGLLFFYSQLLTGDKVDNIPGCPKAGVVAVEQLLSEARTESEACRAVAQKYKENVGERWKEYLLEQGQLLWLVRELNEDGTPKVWQLPEELGEMD